MDKFSASVDEISKEAKQIVVLFFRCEHCDKPHPVEPLFIWNEDPRAAIAAAADAYKNHQLKDRIESALVFGMPVMTVGMSGKGFLDLMKMPEAELHRKLEKAGPDDLDGIHSS